MFKVYASNQVRKFLKKLPKKEVKRSLDAFDCLKKNPFLRRPNCDIKKMSGKQDAYRLRIGNIRFNYVVYKNKVMIYIEEAFKRGRGYGK